jgi:hypothetical protein
MLPSNTPGRNSSLYVSTYTLRLLGTEQLIADDSGRIIPVISFIIIYYTANATELFKDRGRIRKKKKRHDNNISLIT